MKKTITLALCIVLSCCAVAQKHILFDDDWHFYRGDIPHAEQTGFDDRSWRLIQLPHDFSIEDLPGKDSPFNPDVINGVSIGFTTGGIGWYRKEFSLPAAHKNKIINLQFDGVYMNADVWINGEHLGNHPYGYTSFQYDITKKIKFDGKNIIAVQVKNEGATSRWYSGSGINRHVWLQIDEPVHVSHWGTYITTTAVSKSSATIHCKTNVMNETGKDAIVKLVTHIHNIKDVEIAKSSSTYLIKAGTDHEFGENIVIKSPQLWSIESPALYTAVSEIYQDGKVSGITKTTFGVRRISFDVKEGFLLNGKSLKLKGGCFHIDNGPLGARSFDRAEERRAELMKASGFNAIRCSHNPPAPAFLDACDRLGMLVIDEAFDMWADGKNDKDYHLYFNNWWQKDIESMLLRDRNHPSIIMWSIGNEIPNSDEPKVAATAKTLSDYVHSIDSTRPVTAAVNSVSEKKDVFFEALDVTGYNYARDNYESDHQRKPERIMFCTESYPLQAFDYWMSVLDHKYVVGDFVWTGFDYIGEASIGWLGYDQEKSFYPWNLAFCGDIDICGWKRPQSYYRDVLWKKNQLSLFVKPPQPSFPVNPKKRDWSIWNWEDAVEDWNWQGNEGNPLEVNVYSSYDAVELFLNGKSLGRQSTDRSTKFIAKFQVPYEAGILKAVGYSGSEKIATVELQTADQPVKIKLTADRKIVKADGEDLSYITVELLDEKGNRNPKADNEVKFSISGEAIIAGVGNANPTSVESYQLPQRKAWQGRCLVVVKAGTHASNIILKASADGLQENSIEIRSK